MSEKSREEGKVLVALSPSRPHRSNKFPFVAEPTHAEDPPDLDRFWDWLQARGENGLPSPLRVICRCWFRRPEVMLKALRELEAQGRVRLTDDGWEAM